MALKLNELKPNAGATQNSKRVGRGIGSGKGKTCGSGVKGQKARTGVAIKGFEGGQMPIFQRLPKRGFVNINRKEIKPINLGVLQSLIDSKALDASKKVTKEVLASIGLIKNKSVLIKILATGEIKSAIQIETDLVSESARKQIEKAKGTVIEAGA